MNEKIMKGDEALETRRTLDTLTIFTMLVRCPKEGAPNTTCPFAQFRGAYGLEEKFQLAEAFPEGQRREMLAFHQHCLAVAYAKDKNDNWLEFLTARTGGPGGDTCDKEAGQTLRICRPPAGGRSLIWEMGARILRKISTRKRPRSKA